MYSPKRTNLMASEAEELRSQLAEAQRQLKTATEALKGNRNSRGESESDKVVQDLRKQLALERQVVADLKKSKASLESIIASSAGEAQSTLLEDLKKQLDEQKAEIEDLTAKKNKYKKHAKQADGKLKDLKKKVDSLEKGGGGGGAAGGGDSSKEIEELRATNIRLEKKLKAAKQDYDELEKEIATLEEENLELEEELRKNRK